MNNTDMTMAIQHFIRKGEIILFMELSIYAKVAVFPIKINYLCGIVILNEMNFRRLILIAAAVASMVSCKKDDDTEVMPSLQGDMEIIGLTEFIRPNQTCTLKVKGAVHPEGKEMTYSWKVSPSMTKYDTTDVFIHTFSDTLQTYTVVCTAAADGYISNSDTKYTTIVKGGRNGSITGTGYASDASYQLIGNQTWTTANSDEGEGTPFRHAEVMAGVFGRFYNFEQAKAACESMEGSWTLPSKEDWEILESYIKSSSDMGKSTAAALMLQDAKFNGVLLWEYWPAVGDITNKTRFSAIPAGYANILSGSFTGTYEYAAFWTSTEVEEDSSMGYYKYLICDEPDMFTGKADKESFGASVRCIRK